MWCGSSPQTLSPALCAVFLRRTGPRRGVMGRVLGGLDWVRDRYARGVRRLLRMAVLSVPVVALCAGGIFGLSLITPTGFLPEEDQRAFFVMVQLPDSASVPRTSDVTGLVEAKIRQLDGVEHVLSIIGFSLLDGGAEPNAALLVVRLKPFAERANVTQSAQVLRRVQIETSFCGESPTPSFR